MNITDFLLARIEEDESEAKLVLALGDNGSSPVQHPIRVLAECAAKRAIIEEHSSVHDTNWLSGKEHGYLWCGACGTLDDAPVPFPCYTVQTLAAIYHAHPDYQREWANG